MIIDISDSEFKRIFQDNDFNLPIRWTGDDYLVFLSELFKKYCSNIKSSFCGEGSKELCKKIQSICERIKHSVSRYLEGFPDRAYGIFSKLMKEILLDSPLKVHEKSSKEELGYAFYDKLRLFRVACVEDNIKYGRNRVFHPPYNLRSKISTNRYSIAGYPSLYLGTNLELCCEEAHYNRYSDYGIASRFQLVREISRNLTRIRVIDLAIKPQDFIQDNEIDRNYRREREERSNNPFNKQACEHDRQYLAQAVIEHAGNQRQIRYSYLLWYPVIAACSFIRANKKDPFAVEYVIPQLLMQWVRSEIKDEIKDKKHNEKQNQLIGVRYFSCASERASDLGFNYVFPVSGREDEKGFHFCPILMGAFELTKPHFLNNYESIEACERALNNDMNLCSVENDN